MTKKRMLRDITSVILLVLLIFLGGAAQAESDVPATLNGIVVQGDNGKTFAAGAPLASIIADYSELDHPREQDVELKILTDDPGFISTMNAPLGFDQGNEIPYVVYDSTVAGAKTIKSKQDNWFTGDLFSYTYKNAAHLADGTALDVVITYSNMNLVLQDTLNTDTTPYKCRTGIALGDMLRTGNNFTASASHRYGLQIDVKMQAYDHQGNIVNGTALYAVSDVDVLRNGSNFISLNGSGTNTAAKNHNYSEQIQVNGILPSDGILASPIYIPDHAGVDDPMGTGYKCGIEKVGDDAVNFYARGIRDDDPGTFYSGFAVLVNNSKGLRMTVRSSGGNIASGTSVIVRTKLLSTTTNPPLHHRIVSTTTRGGNITVPLGGGVAGYSPEGQNPMGPGTVTVLDGTTVTYTMTPQRGWEIFSVTVADEVTGKVNEKEFKKADLQGMAEGDTEVVKLKNDKTCVLKCGKNGSFTFTFPNNDYDHRIEVVWVTKKSVSVKKVWEDNNNQDGIRPATATLELVPWVEYNGEQAALTEAEMKLLGSAYPRTTISSASGNEQKASWTDLPALVPTGAEGLEHYWDLDIHYSPSEPNLPDGYILYTEEGGTNSFTMTARYVAGMAELSAVKHILGRDWLEEDTFTFRLTPVDGAPLRTYDGLTHTALEAVADDTTLHHTAVFKPLKFVVSDLQDAGEKTFTYRIEEIVPADPRGLTYAAARTVTVHVSNKDNVLTVTYGDDQTHTFTAPDFYNRYQAKGQVSVSLPAEKVFLDQNGVPLKDWGGASFVLELDRADDSSPLPAVVRQTVTAENPAVTFGEITFTAPGHYRYVIREVLLAGMDPLHPVDTKYLYETAVHEIEVLVEDNGRGGLSAPEIVCDSAKEHAETGVHHFRNQLLPEAWTVLEVRKELTGGRLQEGAFSFALYRSDKNGYHGDELQRTGNDENGAVLFSPLVFYHDVLFAANVNPDEPARDPGETDVTLYYLVQELVHEEGDYSEETGIIFDREPVLFEITVHHSADHHLSVKRVRYRKGSGDWKAFSDKELPFFRNRDEAHGLIEIGVSKRVSGRDWTKEDRFDFILTAQNGAPLNGEKMLKVSADTGKRDVWFDNIQVTPADMYDAGTGTYLKEKTFRYRIHEFADDGKDGDLNDGSGNAGPAKGSTGFTYPADELVTVHVKETDDGSLHVTYGSVEETMLNLPVFLNEWEEIPADPTPTPEPAPVPETGDDARLMWWVCLIMLGLAGKGILAIRKKR